MSMRWRAVAHGWLAALTLGLSGCAYDVTDELENGSWEVVGGAAESGYAPVGYLVRRNADRTRHWGPICGVTLVSPTTAVTAAHCVRDTTMTYGIGFGDVWTGAVYFAREVHRHPLYDDTQRTRYRHDLAVLVLERAVIGVAPATIVRAHLDPDAARPSCAGRMRYVGYGRTQEGNHDTSRGSGPRRSARFCVDAMDSYNIWARGSDGGLCWGDSGGPLLEDGDTAITGVLADFADRRYYCDTSNRMIFTSLWIEHVFLTESGVPPESFDEPLPTEPDADADGVPDHADLCTRTPAGARVWMSGPWIGCAGGQHRDR